MLRPANNQPWPPAFSPVFSTDSLFTSWARSTEKRLAFPEVLSGQSISTLNLDAGELIKDRLPAAFMFRSTFFCAQCRPTLPPPQSEGVRRLAKRLPEMDWLRPGVGVPQAYAGPVRMDAWYPDNSRTKTVIDPWAWWSVGIHYPGLGVSALPQASTRLTSTCQRTDTWLLTLLTVRRVGRLPRPLLHLGPLRHPVPVRLVLHGHLPLALRAQHGLGHAPSSVQ